MKETVETTDYDNKFGILLQYALNGGLTTLGLVLVTILGRELYHLILAVYEMADLNTILKKVLDFFLVFEFLVMITKYFISGHHFPLRYFIYIGITAILRTMIVEHDYTNVLMMSGSIFILLLCLYIASSERLKNKG